MEWIILAGLFWLVWWLFKGRKEQETLKRWEIAPIKNASLAKDYGWFISKESKTNGLSNQLTKFEQPPSKYIQLTKHNISTEFTITFQQDGATLSAYNAWCKAETLQNECFYWMRVSSISEAESAKTIMLHKIAEDLEQIGMMKCR